MSRRASTRLASVPHKSMKDTSDSDEDEEVIISDNEDIEDVVVVDRAQESEKQKRGKAALKGITLEEQLLEIPGVPRRRKKAVPIVVQSTGLSLIELLIKHPEAAPSAAKAWVADYVDNPVPATAKLLSLIVQVAGADVDLTDDDVEGDVDALARRVADTVLREGGMDPLHDRRTGKTLPAGFSLFCTSLIADMDDAELLGKAGDDFALNKVIHTIMALGGSTIRPFRLAATLTASRLVAALVEARKKRSAQLSTAQFQRDVEAKKGKAANQSLLTSLKHSIDEYQQQSESLTANISELMRNIFAVRFRDTQPEVRSLVIRSVGGFVASEPKAFLQDSQLKYLGWALSDRDAAVRSNAATALINLYSELTNVQGLREFKNRFLARLKEMPFDVDEAVAVKTLQLLTRLVNLGEVQPDDVRGLAVLLADDSPALRAGAGDVIAAMMRQQIQQQLQATTQGGSGRAAGKTPAGGGTQAAATTGGGGKAPDKVNESRNKVAVGVLLDLLAWLQPVAKPADPQSQQQQQQQQVSRSPPLEREVLDQIMDSLIDRLPALHDAALLCTVLGDMEFQQLQQQGGSSSDGAQGGVGGPAGAAHLAAVLAYVANKAKQVSAAEANITAAGKKTPSRKKAGSGAAGAAGPPDAAHFTQAVMGALPGLIRQYQTEPPVLCPLLHVCGCLDLEVFALQGEERALGSLLGLVADQVTRHTSLHVLNEAVECLVRASDTGPGTLRAAAELALSTSVSKTATGLVAAVKAVTRMSGDDLADEVQELQEAAGNSEVPEGCEAVWKLQTSLSRAAALLTKGATQLAAHQGARDALATLLVNTSGLPKSVAEDPDQIYDANDEQLEEPRLLGVDVTGLALAATHAALLCDLLRMGVTGTDQDHALTSNGNATVGAEKDTDADKQVDDAMDAEDTERAAAATSKGKKGAKNTPKKKKDAGKKGGKRKASGDNESEADSDAEEEDAEKSHGSDDENNSDKADDEEDGEDEEEDTAANGKGNKRKRGAQQKGRGTRPAKKARRGSSVDGDKSAAPDAVTPAAGKLPGAVMNMQEAAQKLAAAIAQHAKVLSRLYDVSKDDPAMRDVVSRSMSDLLITFGVATWSGSVASPAALSDALCEQLVTKVWAACAAVLDEAAIEEQEQEDNMQVPYEDLAPEELDMYAIANTDRAARKIMAVGTAARLLMAPAALPVKHRRWLTANLLGMLPFNGPEVEQQLRDLAAALRKECAASNTGPTMSELVLDTLKISYRPVLQEAAAQEAAAATQDPNTQANAPPDTTKLEAALGHFGAVAENMSSLYSVAGVNREELLAVFKGVLQYCLVASATPRPRMYMLAWGLSHLVPKLTPADAGTMMSELETAMDAAQRTAPRAVAEVNEDDEEEEAVEAVTDPHWAQADHLVNVLTERAKAAPTPGPGKGRGAGRSAMKGGRAAAAARRASAEGDADADGDANVTSPAAAAGTATKARKAKKGQQQDDAEGQHDGEGQADEDGGTGQNVEQVDGTTGKRGTKRKAAAAKSPKKKTPSSATPKDDDNDQEGQVEDAEEKGQEEEEEEEERPRRRARFALSGRAGKAQEDTQETEGHEVLPGSSAAAATKRGSRAGKAKANTTSIGGSPQQQRAAAARKVQVDEDPILQDEEDLAEEAAAKAATTARGRAAGAARQPPKPGGAAAKTQEGWNKVVRSPVKKSAASGGGSPAAAAAKRSSAAAARRAAAAVPAPSDLAASQDDDEDHDDLLIGTASQAPPSESQQLPRSSAATNKRTTRHTAAAAAASQGPGEAPARTTRATTRSSGRAVLPTSGGRRGTTTSTSDPKKAAAAREHEDDNDNDDDEAVEGEEEEEEDQGQDEEDSGDDKNQMNNQAGGEPAEDQEADNEDEEDGEGSEQERSADAEDDDDEEEAGDVAGDVPVFAAEEPSQSTQVSEPPPRVAMTRRRRI